MLNLPDTFLFPLYILLPSVAISSRPLSLTVPFRWFEPTLFLNVHNPTQRPRLSHPPPPHHSSSTSCNNIPIPHHPTHIQFLPSREPSEIATIDSISSILLDQYHFVASSLPTSTQNQSPPSSTKLAVPQSPATAAPVAPSTPAVPSKEDTNLACQWTACQEKFETPEDLYVCCSHLFLCRR